VLFRSAGLLAVRILGAHDAALREQMTGFQERLRDEAVLKGAALRRGRADSLGGG
jgi:5-(carboxyamino)imidazole ribonucleotide mutase